MLFAKINYYPSYHQSKISRSLGRLRSWIAEQQINYDIRIVLPRLSKKHQLEMYQDAIAKSNVSLIESINSIAPKVFTETKDVLELSKYLSQYSPPNPADGMIIDLLFSNFCLWQELRHYKNQLREINDEEKRTASQIKNAMPAWMKKSIRWDKSRNKRDKEKWKFNWMLDGMQSGSSMFDYPINYLIAGMSFIVTLGFLAVPVLSTLYYGPDHLIKNIANFLFQFSQKTGATFQEAYAGFGFALLILLSIAGLFILPAFRPNTKTEDAVSELDYRMQDRLAELAYEFEKFKENQDPLVALEIRRLLDEMNIRNGLS